MFAAAAPHQRSAAETKGRTDFKTDTSLFLTEQETTTQIFLHDHPVIHDDQSPYASKDKILDRLVSQRTERKEEDGRRAHPFEHLVSYAPLIIGETRWYRF